jgi:hypothetical protein
VVAKPTIPVDETIMAESHLIAQLQWEQGRSLDLVPRQNTLPRRLKKTGHSQKTALLIGRRLTHFGAADVVPVGLHRQHLVDKLAVHAGCEKSGAHRRRRKGRGPSLPPQQQQRRNPTRPHKTLIHDAKPLKIIKTIKHCYIFKHPIQMAPPLMQKS